MLRRGAGAVPFISTILPTAAGEWPSDARSATVRRWLPVIADERTSAKMDSCRSSLPKERDPRLITVRRVGTLTDEHHVLLAEWAVLCAEHVLPLFEQEQPSDPRPRETNCQRRVKSEQVSTLGGQSSVVDTTTELSRANGTAETG
jgi:hypothetical protein